jgi:hypothetical protein
MRSRILRVLLAALGAGAVTALLLAASCGAPTTPGPDYTKHPTSALIEVPYPPPPARVEVVPKQPNGNAVWIDGEWTWQTRRWAWKPGRWIAPPRNAKFAPWTTVRDQVGTLYVATGIWRDSKGQEVEEPAPLAIGKPSPASIVSPEGDDVPRGPLAPIDSGAARNGSLDPDAAMLNEAVERLDASRTTMPMPSADGAAAVGGDQ